MKRIISLLQDLRYFFLIMLLMLLIVIFWIPLKILSVFFKDRITRQFVKIFYGFD